MFAVLTIYFSASRTLFGSEFPAAQIMTSFFSWDDNFKAIMTGIGSRSSIRKGHADREKIFTIMSRYFQDHLAETAPVIRLQVEKFTALGASWDLTVRAIALGFLWAGTANSTPIAAWAAAFIYKDEGLAQMLRDELAHADSSISLDERIPSAQCVAEEAIRLTMLGSIVRLVLKDTLVPTAEGGHLHVRKGDMVLGQCREMHRAFDRPEEFIFDRVKKAREADKANLGYIPFTVGKKIAR
jgi:cytochrome P450